MILNKRNKNLVKTVWTTYHALKRVLVFYNAPFISVEIFREIVDFVYSF